MKTLIDNQKKLTVLSLIMLVVYVLVFLLKITGVINCVNVIFLLVPIAGIILQTLLFIFSTITENNCEEKNLNMIILVVWVIVIIVTFTYR